MSAMGLTPKQQRCKSFIGTYITMHGHSPSYDEIRDNLGLKSKGQVFNLIDNLLTRGHIRHVKNASRSIQIISDACPTCGHEGG